MRTLAVILALSPVLLHAQTKSPAQPESTPVLRSSLTQPITSLHSNSAAATPVRISTGVVAPKLIHSVPVVETETASSVAPSPFRSAVVDLTVDANGVPQNVTVVSSSDPVINRDLVAAIKEFRYKPATVSGMPVAFPLTLQCNISHGE